MTVSSSELQTGDILLFSDTTHKGWLVTAFDWLIRAFTKSKYTHAAMVLRDPTWIRDDLEGVYVYESGTEPEPDVEDGKRKLGVQLTRVDVALTAGSPTVCVRRLLKGRELITEEKLRRVHADTHNTPYDFFPVDLLRAGLQIQPDPRAQQTYAMFCSALVCFMCARFGLCSPDADWSETVPGDLCSSACGPLAMPWSPGVEYGTEEPVELTQVP